MLAAMMLPSHLRAITMELSVGHSPLSQKQGKSLQRIPEKKSPSNGKARRLEQQDTEALVWLSGFGGAKTVAVKKPSNRKTDKLKAEEKYYVRIRAYKTVESGKEQSVKIF